MTLAQSSPAPSPVASATMAPAAVRVRPLMPVQAVMDRTERTQEQVVDLIDEGRLTWAWDLATAHTRKRCLRVLDACVDAYLAGDECQLEWPEVLGLIFPPNAQDLSAYYVCRILAISDSFLYAILNRKELSTSAGWRCGPGGTARITRESLEVFLIRRCVRQTPETPALGRPLLTASAARQRLDATKEQVDGMVETGRLRWVFNVAPNLEPGALRELRFLPAELDSLSTGGLGLELGDVVAMLLPEGDKAPRIVDVCQVLSIGGGQLEGFVQRGELTALPGRPIRIGYDSISRFLGRRKYPGG